MTSVRTLISIASKLQWPLYQMDVKNAFLNGDLQEEVYMKPPPGLSFPLHHVYRLGHALYGLKQAPHAWFEKLSHTMKKFGFPKCIMSLLFSVALLNMEGFYYHFWG